MELNEQEREMIAAFRVLPLELQNTLRNTIISQGDYYAPERGKAVAQARLSLVIGGRR